MQRSHSPAYVAEIRNRWRIIVPVQGRLAPRICPQEFKTRLCGSSMAAKPVRPRGGRAGARKGVRRQETPDPLRGGGRAALTMGNKRAGAPVFDRRPRNEPNTFCGLTPGSARRKGLPNVREAERSLQNRARTAAMGEVFRNWSILLFGVCFICDFGERVVEQGDVVIASDINNPCRPVLRS